MNIGNFLFKSVSILLKIVVLLFYLDKLSLI